MVGLPFTVNAKLPNRPRGPLRVRKAKVRKISALKNSLTR